VVRPVEPKPSNFMCALRCLDDDGAVVDQHIGCEDRAVHALVDLPLLYMLAVD